MPCLAAYRGDPPLPFQIKSFNSTTRSLLKKWRPLGSFLFRKQNDRNAGFGKDKLGGCGPAVSQVAPSCPFSLSAPINEY